MNPSPMHCTHVFTDVAKTIRQDCPVCLKTELQSTSTLIQELMEARDAALIGADRYRTEGIRLEHALRDAQQALMAQRDLTLRWKRQCHGMVQRITERS